MVNGGPSRGTNWGCLGVSCARTSYSRQLAEGRAAGKQNQDQLPGRVALGSYARLTRMLTPYSPLLFLLGTVYKGYVRPLRLTEGSLSLCAFILSYQSTVCKES